MAVQRRKKTSPKLVFFTDREKSSKRVDISTDRRINFRRRDRLLNGSDHLRSNGPLLIQSLAQHDERNGVIALNQPGRHCRGDVHQERSIPEVAILQREVSDFLSD